jgi:hypothetical protein
VAAIRLPLESCVSSQSHGSSGPCRVNSIHGDCHVNVQTFRRLCEGTHEGVGYCLPQGPSRVDPGDFLINHPWDLLGVRLWSHPNSCEWRLGPETLLPLEDWYSPNTFDILFSTRCPLYECLVPHRQIRWLSQT